MSTDVVQRVLLIPEIQDYIFSFNNVGDVFRCSLVCKSWYPVALDHIWHTLPSLLPLFSLITSVEASRNRHHEGPNFIQNVIASDRTRFSSITARVKYLRVLLNRCISYNSAVFELLKSQPETTGSILPNLKGLIIHAGKRVELLHLLVPFLHFRLEVLEISARPSDRSSSAVEGFLEEVALRSSNLRELTVNATTGSIPKMTSLLIELVSKQKSLEILAVPPGLLTGSVLECLSHLPELRQISFAHHFGNDMDLRLLMTLPCDWRNEGDRFTSLLYLDLPSQLSSAASFITAYPALTNLTELGIGMILCNDVKDLHQFLEVVSDTCKGLEVLELMRDDGEDDGSASLGKCSTPITKDTLAPLISLRALQKFTLNHTEPISISDDALVEFLDRCPKFVELNLNPYPQNSPCVVSLLPSLAVMHRIVRVQPKLERLSMYFNGLNSRFDNLLTDVTIMRFKNLKSLDVGYTLISESDRTAQIIGQVLPADCELTFGTVEEDMEELWNEVDTRLRARFRAAQGEFT